MRRRALLSFPSLALLAALASGCVSNAPGVSTAFDPLFQFPAQATWSWDIEASETPHEPVIRQLDLDPLIQRVTSDVLAIRGYREVESDSPDFLLSYRFAVKSFFSAERSTAVASLSLLLVERESRIRAWMGWTRAELQRTATRSQRAERLRATLDRMFENFPPR